MNYGYIVDIANYIYDNPDLLDLNLKGFWISDREYNTSCSNINSDILRCTASISWDVVQEEIPAVSFVHKYLNVFSLK